MIKYLQKFLGKLGDLEYKYFWVVVGILILITGIALTGFTKLEFESDFSKFNPEGIAVLDLDERIDKNFNGGFSAFLVIIEIDDNFEGIDDIRDPKVMEFLMELEGELKKEQKIQEVRSVGMAFQQGVPEDLEGVKAVIDQIPGGDSFFNAQYSMTPIYISVDVSGSSEDIKEINQRVKEIVDSSSKPGGVKAVVTGEPPLLAKIFDLMIQDGVVTLLIATIVIFIMLLIIQRSVKDSFTIIVPVLFGVVWTIGFMGWFNIKITIATAAIGAMLLGLGVEYSIFLNSRYKEENKEGKKGIKDGLIKSLSTTGASTFSSGITTIIGFSALTLSLFPMLRDLGFSLAMGIGLILAAVMVVGPIMIIIRDKWITKEKRQRRKKEGEEEKETIFLKAAGTYGNFVGKRTWLVIIIALILTGAMYYGSTLINNQNIDFDTILPEDLEELKAFKLMEDEFEDTTGLVFFIELDPSYTDADEPIDIRDPRIIRYIDILAQKAEQVSYVESVRSISFLEKEANNGIIPGTLAEQKELLSNLDYQSFITDDYTGVLVSIRFNDVVWNDRTDVIMQLYDIIEYTEKPVGIKTHVSGGMVVEHEMDKLIGPDSTRTAIIAFAVIIIFLFLLSRSVKYTVLPLVTVVVAIVWILGMVGFFQVGWNSIISSVISMTIGIGIDFGIQLSNRYRQELETHDKRTAMCRTLKYTLYPMIITVIAALIGFQSMNLGQLKLMGDLGKTMSFSMVASMIVAVSLVAGLMVVFERKKKVKIKTNPNIENLSK